MRPLLLANFSSPAALARCFLTALIGLLLDLWTKAYAFKTLAIDLGNGYVDSRISQFIPGWIHFQLVRNSGAVFGLGQGQRVLFLAVSVLALLFLSYLFATSGHHRLYQFILGMLLAGVLGNMYDRIEFGFVRDMIRALPGWRWPGTWSLPIINYPGSAREVFPWIFNVADILLCTGVGLIVLHYLLHPTHHHSAEDHAHPATQQP
jgi:signal peptidase II